MYVERKDILAVQGWPVHELMVRGIQSGPLNLYNAT